MRNARTQFRLPLTDKNRRRVTRLYVRKAMCVFTQATTNLRLAPIDSAKDISTATNMMLVHATHLHTVPTPVVAQYARAVLGVLTRSE